MNTEQQLIDCHMDGKSGWTLLVIKLIRGPTYKHSGISVEMFFGILFCYYNKVIHKTSEMTYIIMDVGNICFLN